MRQAPLDPPQIRALLDSYAGRTAFDVGGNQGDAAVIFARNFDRVVSFEPAAEAHQVLAQLPGVEAVQAALTDHDGTVVLDEQSESIRSGQLVTTRPETLAWGAHLGRREVPALTLATAAERYGVPDFIKVDVEGHEVAVITGGLDLLRRHRPHLLIEVHWQDLGERIRELLDDTYDFQVIRHPHYRPGQQFWPHHYWLAT